MPSEPFLQLWAGENSGCSIRAQTSVNHPRDSRAVLYHSHMLCYRSRETGRRVSISKSILSPQVSLPDSTVLGCVTKLRFTGGTAWQERDWRVPASRVVQVPHSSAASLLQVQRGWRWWPMCPVWLTCFWCQGEGAGEATGKTHSNSSQIWDQTSRKFCSKLFRSNWDNQSPCLRHYSVAEHCDEHCSWTKVKLCQGSWSLRIFFKVGYYYLAS